MAANTTLNRFNNLSWNQLRDLSFSSKNRTTLAGVVHAENAVIDDGPSHFNHDRGTVSNVIYRAIQNGWEDVLLSAVTSRHMGEREFADILQAERLFSEALYLAIANSKAAQSLPLMGILHSRTRYPAVREAARAAETALICSNIEAIKADLETYGLDGDDEHATVFDTVYNAVQIDRFDLVNELMATGCVGAATKEFAQAAAASFAEFELAMAAEQALAA